MSEKDEIKEEIGWQKLVFAALIAVEASLIGWLAQNYTQAALATSLSAFVAIIAVGFGIIAVNRKAYRGIRRLRDL